MDFYKMCEHIDHIIDQHEGCVICMQCGSVLGMHFLYPSDEDRHSRYNLTSSIKTFLYDCCDRMHLPSSILEIIQKKYSCFHDSLAFEKVDRMQLMAYSIYYTLKDQGIGRNIEYIAYNTGITSKQLWKCESLDPNLAIPISIENLLTPVYTLFHLSKQDHDNIISISRHFQERHFSPLTMTSTLVYLYCKAVKIPISVKKVFSVFNVSSMSIYRCKSYITYEKFHCISENITIEKK